MFEYCNDETIHSILNITFGELLLNVYSLTLCNAHSDEIFAVMNIEMNDALCKCFTGRISRLVNCLNGFDDNVKIGVSDNEQIGNIIISIENNEYNLETHKQLDMTMINEWLDYL